MRPRHQRTQEHRESILEPRLICEICNRVAIATQLVTDASRTPQFVEKLSLVRFAKEHCTSTGLIL